MGDEGRVSNSLVRLKRAPLDLFPRLKTRVALRYKDQILGLIGRLPVDSLASRSLRQTLRHIVGGVLWSVKLEVNNKCDLACRMCYVKKGEDELPFSDIVKVLDDLSGARTRVEILGGEPLLRCDLADIVRYAKEEALIPEVILYTNGREATAKRAAELKEAGLDAALVTLVSSKEAVHDSFVGVDGSWQRTLDGISSLRRAGIEVYGFTALHRENIAEVEEIHNLVTQKLGAHSIFYQYIPQCRDDPLIPDKEDWATAKRWILHEKNQPHAAFVRNFCTLAGSACSGGYFVFTVKVDGTVSPCPFIDDIALGSIREQSIWGIIGGRFSVGEFVRFQSLPAECAKCSYADICNGGCKAGNMNLYGEYSRKDPRCLGPWDEKPRAEKVCDRLPCFF